VTEGRPPGVTTRANIAAVLLLVSGLAVLALDVTGIFG
jgi:hypothetical protein